MENKKGLQIVVYILAAIGLVSLIGIGGFGVKTLIDKSGENKTNEVTQSSEEQDLESAILEQAGVADSEGTAPTEGNTEDLGAIGEPTHDTDAADLAKVLEGDGELVITFLGDSILDNFRDDTGICNIVSKALDATVYNLGIGGVAVSIPRDEVLSDSLDGQVRGSASGIALAEMLAGNYSYNAIFDCTAKTILQENREAIQQSDIFIIEYGINDFRCGRDSCNMDNLMDPQTYEGGLRRVIFSIRQVNPEAEIILCEPSYCYYLRDNGEWIGDSYSLNNGLGSLNDYGGKTAYVAETMHTGIYKLMFQGVGYDNMKEMLLDDGTHLNEKGRRVYAENLLGCMKRQGFIEDYKWDGESHLVDVDKIVAENMAANDGQ